MPRCRACGSIAEHFGQRHRLQRERQPPRFNQRQIQDLIDQVQQVPARLEDLVNAALLRHCGRGVSRFDQLGKPEDGAKRRAQFVAHAGQEVGLGQVGFFRQGTGRFELHVFVLQGLLHLSPFGIHALACGVIGANQQIANDGVMFIAQRSHRHHRREAAAILADIGQLIDVLNSP